MGQPKVGISQSARESIPFSIARDQGDCFFFASEVERRTYHQLLTLPHISLCCSYVELARTGNELGTLGFLAERSTN